MFALNNIRLMADGLRVHKRTELSRVLRKELKKDTCCCCGAKLSDVNRSSTVRNSCVFCARSLEK